MRIGFIGAGQMATALAAGIAHGDTPSEIAAYDPSDAAIDNFRAALDGKEVGVCESTVELARSSDIVFIAVKPQMLEPALTGLTEVFEPGKTYVSVVAGASISRLQELSGSSQIIRTMPNTPCLVGAGAIAISASESVAEDKVDEVRNLLAQVGKVVDVSESQINAVTGLSGSGPAYVYTFIEALIDGGVMTGLPRSVARELAIQTVLGASKMVAESSDHPASLRDRVTSPGGTTIHGMAALEEIGFRKGVSSAVIAATKRAAELGV